MDIKFSVIIPTYNDANHIVKAIDSVLDQVYLNFEIIVIDDGSTDNTSFILDSYKDNKKIFISHIDNVGLGEARNTGMQYASGDFILFLDSDDRIVPGCLDVLHRHLKKDNVDVLFFCTDLVFEGNASYSGNYYKRPDLLYNTVMESKNFYNVSIDHTIKHGFGYPAVVWAYVFNRVKYKSAKFYQRIHEDNYFTTNLLISVPDASVKCIHDKLHLHTIRENSIMTSKEEQLSVYCYIDAIKSLLPLSNTINDRDTIKSLQYNILILIRGAVSINKNLEYKSIPPKEIITLVSKMIPALGKSKNKCALLMLMHVMQYIARAYNIENDKDVIFITKLITSVINKKSINVTSIPVVNKNTSNDIWHKNKSLSLLLNNKRFDLIIKYLYILNLNKNIHFFEEMYLDHILAFNNFHEIYPSDGVEKIGADAFISRFLSLYNDICINGFDSSKGSVPIGNNGDIQDGAHRLSICAYLNIDVSTEETLKNLSWDYKFFQGKGINQLYADYAAIEYVKLNKHAYIVNLHSVTDKSKDSQVEDILKKYGYIFYKKDINLTFNGYVNLKKISYGEFWERATWIGSVKNSYKGARDHALKSIGDSPLRAYVFICDDLNNIIAAKKEIRDLFGIGNFSIHVNDTRDEALRLSQIYFNVNSLEIINNRPLGFEDYDFDNLLEELIDDANNNDIDLNDICVVGSTPLNILGLRKSNDLDFLYSGEKTFSPRSCKISSHDSQLKYYPCSKDELIYNPRNFFYYRGIKFISLEILYQMKMNRNERPKDIDDCLKIMSVKNSMN